MENECSRQYMGARDMDEIKRRRMLKRPVGDIYINCGGSYGVKSFIGSAHWGSQGGGAKSGVAANWCGGIRFGKTGFQ